MENIWMNEWRLVIGQCVLVNMSHHHETTIHKNTWWSMPWEWLNSFQRGMHPVPLVIANDQTGVLSLQSTCDRCGYTSQGSRVLFLGYVNHSRLLLLTNFWTNKLTSWHLSPSGFRPYATATFLRALMSARWNFSSYAEKAELCAGLSCSMLEEEEDDKKSGAVGLFWTPAIFMNFKWFPALLIFVLVQKE